MKARSGTIYAATRYVNQNYGFLLQRGYEISSIDDAEVGWQVDLKKADLFMKVLWTREEEYVFFRSALQPSSQFVNLELVLTVITGEKRDIDWRSHVKDVQRYIDQIEAYYAGEYLRDPDRLRAAVDEYNAALPQPEVYRPEEPGARKEPKRIAILYYPLMAVILLLLFLVLTTLYAVLLDRLFAAFSLEPDSYSLYMGVGAILLSIGTLLLFRGRRQKS